MEEEKKGKREVSQRAEFSPFAVDLGLMIEAKRLALNNLYLFDHLYLEEPKHGFIALEQTYNYYRYARSMMGSNDKKKKMDAKFGELRGKFWDFEDQVENRRRQMHIPQVKTNIREKYRLLRGELSQLLDEIMELAQQRGLGIPATKEMTAYSKLHNAIVGR